MLGLIDKHIEIRSNNSGKYKVLNAISYVHWNAEEQSFIIEVPIILKNLLVSYKKGGYTPINLDNYLVLKSISSQRLYELIRAYTKYNKETVVEYALKEIKELLSLDNSYGLFSNFRKKVIEHAVAEFQANKLFKISKVEYAKEGKNVVSIKFYITDLIPKDYNSKKIDSDGNAPIDGQIDLDELLG